MDFLKNCTLQDTLFQIEWLKSQILHFLDILICIVGKQYYFHAIFSEVTQIISCPVFASSKMPQNRSLGTLDFFDTHFWCLLGSSYQIKPLWEHQYQFFTVFSDVKKIASRPIFAYIPSIANRPKNDPKWVLKHLEPIFFQLIYGFLVSNNHLVPFRGHFSGFSNLKGLNIGAAYSARGWLRPPLTLALASQRLTQASLMLAWGGRAYVSTDVRTYRFPLCSTGLRPPLGPKPKKAYSDLQEAGSILPHAYSILLFYQRLTQASHQLA